MINTNDTFTQELADYYIHEIEEEVVADPEYARSLLAMMDPLALLKAHMQLVLNEADGAISDSGDDARLFKAGEERAEDAKRLLALLERGEIRWTPEADDDR